MKIAVNTRLLLKNRLEGIGWFSFELLKRITKNHPEHEFVFIFDRPFSDEFIFSDNIKPVIVPPQARHPFLFYLWFEYSVPYIIKKTKSDMFFSPDSYLSLKTKVPQLQVIHDLGFEHFPNLVTYINQCYYKYYFPRYAQKATRIVSVSEYTKQDIISRYNINPDKIDIVNNASRDCFEVLTKERKELNKKKYSLGEDYFLYVGALNPRKNIANLLRAFDKFKSNKPSKVKLLLAGQKMWLTGDLDLAFQEMKHSDDVIFLGRIEETELKEIIGSALCLVYPSLFEGFGIPLVEAMNAGVPIITSSTSSMPEVGGNAALYIDPYSFETITTAMESIFLDEDLRNDLIQKGQIRKTNFSWDKSANDLWKSIERTLG